MKLFAQIRYIVWKDLTSEFRTKEMLSSMFIFSFLVIVIFGFAFKPLQSTTREVFPGILWVAFTFAGILGLNRSFASERGNDALQGLLLAPIDRASIYFGKVITNMILMGLMELVSLPLAFVFFNVRLGGSVGGLILVIFLGTLGFVAMGTFLAAVASNARTSEILLPLILFPVLVPVIIAAVEATGLVLGGSSIADAGSWLKLMLIYDVIFLVVPFILFDYVLEV
ncbi:MAG: heme exporter protein CcmB [Bacillota bacterium]